MVVPGLWWPPVGGTGTRSEAAHHSANTGCRQGSGTAAAVPWGVPTPLPAPRHGTAQARVPCRGGACPPTPPPRADHPSCSRSPCHCWRPVECSTRAILPELCLLSLAMLQFAVGALETARHRGAWGARTRQHRAARPVLAPPPRCGVSPSLLTPAASSSLPPSSNGPATHPASSC